MQHNSSDSWGQKRSYLIGLTSFDKPFVLTSACQQLTRWSGLVPHHDVRPICGSKVFVSTVYKLWMLKVWQISYNTRLRHLELVVVADLRELPRCENEDFEAGGSNTGEELFLSPRRSSLNTRMCTSSQPTLGQLTKLRGENLANDSDGFCKAFSQRNTEIIKHTPRVQEQKFKQFWHLSSTMDMVIKSLSLIRTGLMNLRGMTSQQGWPKKDQNLIHSSTNLPQRESHQ